MDFTRRTFLGSTVAISAAAALPGCASLFGGQSKKSRIAVQLYSIRGYIGGKNGVGLKQALKDVAAIGYRGVEFAGYYDFKSAELKAMLADAGLTACGTHINRTDIMPDTIGRTCEFNLAYGNNLLICPGGGNFPEGDCTIPSKKNDDWWKFLADFYGKASGQAAKYGCKVGIHNHYNEFRAKLTTGQTMFDYFFSNTPAAVCMEQDVGWTTYAGVDPCEAYKKFPHRSITLHAKENGMGAKQFDAILGQPGEGAKGVDWDNLFKVTDADGVKWYVVECERHDDSLAAVKPSFEFLKGKGRA